VNWSRTQGGWTPTGSYGNLGITERAEAAERPELRRIPKRRSSQNFYSRHFGE
jgi:hypothetical protein